MGFPLYLFPCAAILLEGLLLFRFLKKRFSHRYPYLVSFVVFDFLCNIILFPVNLYKPQWFAGVYWRMESLSLFFRLFVNWEFYRGVFGRRSALYDIGWKVLLAVELFALPAVLVLSWTQVSTVHFSFQHLSPVVEQYFSLVQAFLLLTPAAVACYYCLAWGRNMRGLGFGFGIYLLVRTVNFASLQAFRGFLPYWQLLTPISFIGMIGIWLWAFWEYAPSPELATVDETQSDQQKAEWQRRWTRTMRLLGRGIS